LIIWHKKGHPGIIAWFIALVAAPGKIKYDSLAIATVMYRRRECSRK
jgi:hypothetical protein